jgi:hypothetical protein
VNEVAPRDVPVHAEQAIFLVHGSEYIARIGVTPNL